MKKDRLSVNELFLIIGLLFIFVATLGAGSMKEIQVTGKIYIMGNEPFTHVAIESDDGQVYALVGEQSKEIRRLQGKRVSVAGMPSEEKPRGAKAIEVRSYKVLEQK